MTHVPTFKIFIKIKLVKGPIVYLSGPFYIKLPHFPSKKKSIDELYHGIFCASG